VADVRIGFADRILQQKATGDADRNVHFRCGPGILGPLKFLWACPLDEFLPGRGAFGYKVQERE